MRRVLVIGSLAGGGAERVVATLANAWAERGDEVHLLTLDDGSDVAYELHPDVRYAPLGLRRPASSTWAAVAETLRSAGHLRAALRRLRPDVVVSFIDLVNVLTLIATRAWRVPVVVSERVALDRHPIGERWQRLRAWLYPRASSIVVQTERSVDTLPTRARARARVIANPVRRPARRHTPRSGSGERSLVALGRLAHQKGFDLLIDAFAEVAPRYPDWTLTIHGEGSERAALEGRIATRDMGARIALPGRTTEPDEALANADLFVLPSRYEGFPNALAEAMAVGLPCVAADCPTGPRELVQDGVDGLLVPAEDPGSLATALASCMGDDRLRAELAAAAPERLERYAPERILDAWDALFSELVSAR